MPLLPGDSLGGTVSSRGLGSFVKRGLKEVSEFWLLDVFPLNMEIATSERDSISVQTGAVEIGNSTLVSLKIGDGMGISFLLKRRRFLGVEDRKPVFLAGEALGKTSSLFGRVIRMFSLTDSSYLSSTSNLC